MHAELLTRTRDLIAGCECEHGCPTCVGPIGNTGPLAKTVGCRGFCSCSWTRRARARERRMNLPERLRERRGAVRGSGAPGAGPALGSPVYVGRVPRTGASNVRGPGMTMILEMLGGEWREVARAAVPRHRSSVLARSSPWSRGRCRQCAAEVTVAGPSLVAARAVDHEVATCCSSISKRPVLRAAPARTRSWSAVDGSRTRRSGSASSCSPAYGAERGLLEDVADASRRSRRARHVQRQDVRRAAA